MTLVAHRPEETTEVFAHHFNAGDIDRLIAAYYAEGAVLAAQPGTPASGADLRAGLQNFLAPGASITATTRHKLVAGDTALLVIDWVSRALIPTESRPSSRAPRRTWSAGVGTAFGAASSTTRTEFPSHARTWSPPHLSSCSLQASAGGETVGTESLSTARRCPLQSACRG